MKKFRFIFLSATALLLASFVWTSCNHGRPCFRIPDDLSGEPYGATDITAISGNQGLTVGFNQEGTITVLKWPNPSYYDQVKFMTGQRTDPDLGALANEGVFSGVYYEGRGGKGFFWLRDAVVGHEYLGDRSVVVVTSFEDQASGLVIEQRDFVDPDEDMLWRHYRIKKSTGPIVKNVRLVSYLNLSPKVSKYAFLPLSDWCLDEVGSSSLEWKESNDLFVQSKQGKDQSTGRDEKVFLAFGFDQKSAGHQAGYDSRCSIKRAPKKGDTFKFADRGELPGWDKANGQVTAGLSADVAFDERGEASLSLLISAADTEQKATSLVGAGRENGYDRAFSKVEDTWHERLARVPLPNTNDARIRRLALRSVIVLYLGYCRDSGAGVASISTQPPYGLDWPRDGVYMNEALMEAGFPELARARNLFWTRHQSRPGDEVRHVPAGNWASNYFADGTPGFPIIWWEIDETGWAPWGIVRYWLATGDDEYLAQIYPSVKLAADFLVEFKDPETGLPEKAYEDDDPRPRHTIHGGVPCYLGLTHAAMAAEAMGDLASQKRWEQRAEELKQAMLDQFYDPVCGKFVSDSDQKGDCEQPGTGDSGLLLWPGEVLEPGSDMAEQAAEQRWLSLDKSFIGERDRGMYEVYGLLSLAKYWNGRPDKMDLVKKGLVWSATVPVSDTGHFGEVWLTVNGKISPGEAQPHLWHHALFYLAALEAYGRDR